MWSVCRKWGGTRHVAEAVGLANLCIVAPRLARNGSTKFEVDLSKSSTQEMYIVNNTDSPLRVGIAPESDKKFRYNLNSNIKVFPKVVSVKPAGKQIVR